MEPLLTSCLLLIPIFIFFFLKTTTEKPMKERRQAGRLPPGPKNLPIIGSIHLLFRRQPPHQTVRDLSAVYGPIMHLKLGEINTIIISSAEAAREIMSTHDLAFASRPLTATIKALLYDGKDLIFAPYGEYWRQMRRLCIIELFSPKRVYSFRAIREEEVSHFVKSITDTVPSGVIVNISNMLTTLSNNIMCRVLIGGRSDDQKLFLSALEDVIQLTSGFSMVDLFPSMPNFIRRVAGFQRRLERCSMKLDQTVDKIVQEHREKRAQNSRVLDHGEMKEECLTDVLLKIQKDDSIQFPLTNTQIKALISDILLAGSETAATTIEWVMSELLRNPTSMEKARKEVREVLHESVGKMMGEEFSGKLSYLQLVIKETLRLHPPVPLLLPRENQKWCEVMSYEIPEKTTVMVNVWAIGRDYKYWAEPLIFRPERFEEKSIDFKGTHFEFIPFGAGRRICPGIQFGLATVELTLAYLLYYFDWEYPTINGEELDMSEAFGVATKRKTPLCLRAIPLVPLHAV